jgi:RNA 2',3'-cyclic 3'-phosphodiesterase
MTLLLQNRLFFALRPAPAELFRLRSHRNRIEDGHGHVRDDRLHVTLGITEDFDSFPERAAIAMQAIGAAVTAGPVPVVLDRLVASARSVALRPDRPSQALRDLHHQLDGPLARLGLRRPDWAFSPHVTLAYREGAPFEQRIDPIAWESQEFVLIHSLLGATEHRELARWLLERRQGELFH